MNQSKKKKKSENSYEFFLQIQWKLFVLELTDLNDVLPQLHLAAIFVTSGSKRILIVLNAFLNCWVFKLKYSFLLQIHDVFKYTLGLSTTTYTHLNK